MPPGLTTHSSTRGTTAAHDGLNTDVKPAPLRLADTVGRLRNGVWTSQGAHWGFYEATRRLLALRRR